MANVGELIVKVNVSDEVQQEIDGLRHNMIVLRDAHNHLIQRVEMLEKTQGVEHGGGGAIKDDGTADDQAVPLPPRTRDGGK